MRKSADSELHSLLAHAVRGACEEEIDAFKPGNVSHASPGYELRARDFIVSAEAIASPISAPGIGVGERILTAIQATRQAVTTNTNLGIVLLAAPLLQAAWRKRPEDTLRHTLEQVLENLSVEDAVAAYAAIRLAQPGGLGEVAQHDVSQTPSISLYAAMQEAAERDTIALQYVSGYRLVFELGLNCLERSLARGMSQRWATVTCYLALLARVPDSLIVRKHGYRTAREVSLQAAPLMQALENNQQPESLLPRLETWDRELKARRINPGTSADLTVAALLAFKLQRIFFRS